jgi:ABC-type transporter Mla subunit MlaD
MDENVFRIVVTVAVVVASLAFVVQAIIMLELYRVTRKTQQGAEAFFNKMEPVAAKVGPVLDKAAIAIEKAGPAIERIGPMMDQAKPVIQRVGPVLDDARAVVAKAGRFVDRASDLVNTANLVVTDNRPQVKQISQEAVEISRQAREQVERIGDLIHDAGDRARARLTQIDETVDSTIAQVENAGGAVKRAVMRPVKEANGVAAGISAAVSTLVRGHRRSSVDAATQDEEMFI